MYTIIKNIKARERFYMARYRKSYDEQLEALEVQISKIQGKLDSLLEQRDIILSKKREDELAELYQTLQDNDVTIDEVLNIIRENNMKTA